MITDPNRLLPQHCESLKIYMTLRTPNDFWYNIDDLIALQNWQRERHEKFMESYPGLKIYIGDYINQDK